MSRHCCIALCTGNISHFCLTHRKQWDWGGFELELVDPQSWLLSVALAKIHPGLSVRGGKFFPWTVGLQQKRTGQIGSGVKAEPELVSGGSSPT